MELGETKYGESIATKKSSVAAGRARFAATDPGLVPKLSYGSQPVRASTSFSGG